ncbi:hypothetical protein Tco_1509101 [Tanacetum coccineum]
MVKVHTQRKLTKIDRLIDQGCVNTEMLNNRMVLMKSLNEFNSLEAMEAAQKAKVRWSIEGDENTKYFRGILNNKRLQLSIRGVLVDGEWVVDPVNVNNACFSHFANRFDKSQHFRIHLDSQFPTMLSTDQLEELEREVTYEEVKKAMWDCSEKNYVLVVIHSNSFIGIGVDMRDVARATNIVGCSNSSMPFSYMGVKVHFSISWYSGILDGSRRKTSRKFPWLDIIKEVENLKSKGIDLMGFCTKKVGNGVDTLFWEDIWMREFPLKCHYRRSYVLETVKQISIADKFRFASVDSSFRRVPRGGVEVEQSKELRSRLALVQFAQMNDRWSWSPTGDGEFSVK